MNDGDSHSGGILSSRVGGAHVRNILSSRTVEFQRDWVPIAPDPCIFFLKNS